MSATVRKMQKIFGNVKRGKKFVKFEKRVAMLEKQVGENCLRKNNWKPKKFNCQVIFSLVESVWEIGFGVFSKYV
jgi:hypothetical protein